MKRKLLSILCILTVLTLAYVPAGQAANPSSGYAEYLQAVMDMAQSNYNFEVSDQELLEGAMKGIFSSMDDYTEYFTREEAKGFMQTVGGKYEGIGVVLAEIEGYATITRVFPSSPAEKAGLLPGDKIAVVDKTEVFKKSIDQVTSLIKGEAGTPVTLKIIRDGSQNLLTINVIRAQIKINPVSYEIRNGIGYISIDTFNSYAAPSLRSVLEVMDNNNIKQVVLDLRNNTGGEVQQAVDVAQQFVPKGTITTLNFKSPDIKDIVYESSLEAPKYKLVVLVNGLTASASEILAGAIQDTKAGVLVGTKTFGKARVQEVIPLLTPAAFQKYSRPGSRILNANDLDEDIPDNEILGYAKLTVGIYTTPAGRMIDTKGLDPDYQVEDHDLVNDIYVNNVVKLTVKDKPTLNSESLDVYNAEKILRLSGYEVDMPDTRLDAKTSAALAEFQQDCGLWPYGTLDFATQKALNEKLDSLMLQIDKQYAKAVELLKK